jgi:hypothetical protein
VCKCARVVCVMCARVVCVMCARGVCDVCASVLCVYVCLCLSMCIWSVWGVYV